MSVKIILQRVCDFCGRLYSWQNEWWIHDKMNENYEDLGFCCKQNFYVQIGYCRSIEHS